MEYAAVFLLFSATVAAAIRMCVCGKGGVLLAFLVLTTLSLCPEQSGYVAGASPALLFCAFAGALYIGFKRDLRAAACSLVVAAVAACVPMSAGADISGLAYLCTAAFCALMLRPFLAGGAFVLGYVLGDTYSFLTDGDVIFRYDLFSVNTVYAAMFCVLLAALVNSVAEAAHPASEGKRILRR